MTIKPTDFGFEIRSAMWAPLKLIAGARKDAGERPEVNTALEREVQDVLAKYTYYYDAKDIDGLLTVFHDECVLINPRGTYIGKEDIKRNYSFLMSQSKVGMHFATNILVRVAEGDSKAWMTAYYYDIGVQLDGRLAGTGGTYADVLVSIDGEWRIVERRITYNFRHVLTPEAPGNSVAPPIPTRPETSRDLIGREWEM